MSDTSKTATDLLDEDSRGCMGEPEAQRLLNMLVFIAFSSPGPRRVEMLRRFAEEFSGTFLCEHHWRKVDAQLAEVMKISPVLQ